MPNRGSQALVPAKEPDIEAATPLQVQASCRYIPGLPGHGYGYCAAKLALFRFLEFRPRPSPRQPGEPHTSYNAVATSSGTARSNLTTSRFPRYFRAASGHGQPDRGGTSSHPPEREGKRERLRLSTVIPAARRHQHGRPRVLDGVAVRTTREDAVEENAVWDRWLTSAALKLHPGLDSSRARAKRPSRATSRHQGRNGWDLWGSSPVPQ
jgi:hypothetical protein